MRKVAQSQGTLPRRIPPRAYLSGRGEIERCADGIVSGGGGCRGGPPPPRVARVADKGGGRRGNIIHGKGGCATPGRLNRKPRRQSPFFNRDTCARRAMLESRDACTHIPGQNSEWSHCFHSVYICESIVYICMHVPMRQPPVGILYSYSRFTRFPQGSENTGVLYPNKNGQLVLRRHFDLSSRARGRAACNPQS